MCSRFFRPLLLCVAALSLLLFSPLHATEITSAGWSGSDFIVGFADSLGYQTDLVASDSSQLVIRLDGATLPQSFATEYAGPGQRRAVLTRAPDGIVRLTVVDSGRLGYSTLWRPYSHRLLVHTFVWSELEYATEQYHKGLLALDQKIYEQAEELLAVAYATGEERAGAVLGAYYAQRGKDSLAARYLQGQNAPDALAARAELARRAGDSATARDLEEKFHTALSATTSAPVTQEVHTDTVRQQPQTTASNDLGVLSDPRLIAIGLMGLILLILVVTWSIRRGARLDQQKTERVAAPPPPPEEEPKQAAPEAKPVPEAKPAPEATPVPQPEHKKTETPQAKQAPVTKPAPPAPIEKKPAETQEEKATSAFSGPPLTFHRIEPGDKHSGLYREEIVHEHPAPEKPAPQSPADAETPAHQTLRDPELTSQATEELPQQSAFVRQTPQAKQRTPTTIQEPKAQPAPAEPASQQPKQKKSKAQEVTAPKAKAAPPAPEPAPQPTETAAPPEPEEPTTPKKILSTQARELQRKIQSRRPDNPAPAEPTKSAARRLNISRDNVELRRMMEESSKKRTGKQP